MYIYHNSDFAQHCQPYILPTHLAADDILQQRPPSLVQHLSQGCCPTAGNPWTCNA